MLKSQLPLFVFVLAVLRLGAGEAVSAKPEIAGPPAPAEAAAPADTNEKTATKSRQSVFVIPVREQIGSPILYIVRRGLKEAIEQKADVVLLDMKTPGGAGDVTFEIMEALDRFPGLTITFVNDEATSAGAFIAAASEEIWFSPRGTIGAAAPVSGSGQDIDPVMREKIVSYLKGRIRAVSEGKGYRGDAISAMIDSKYELKIGDKVLKARDDGLLTLTAKEASATYGDPPQPLLASGIAENVDALLTEKFGANGFTVKQLEVTWSEQLAVWLNAIAPILLGVGLLAIYLEFKTPGFGVFGVVGIVCLAIVFLGSFVAGLSGHEPMIVFGLGLILLLVEILFIPGVGLLAVSGLALMLVSLVWAMADLWPNEPIAVAWSGDAFAGPLANLGLGVALAVALALIFARFLPRGWVWDKLVIQSTIGGAAQVAGGGIEESAGPAALVGREGVAATNLRPGGQVEIDGRRYEARVEIGAVERGRAVIVRAYSDFGLIVEEKS